jgi:hypothetical protein
MFKQVARKLNETVKGLANKFANIDPDLAKYADIKTQEAKIFDAFDSASQNINKKNVMNIIIGGVEDRGSTSLSNDVTRNAVATSLQNVDEALGTTFVNDMRTGQIHNNIFQAMQAGKAPQGSAGALTRGAVGYAVGEKLGQSMGAGPGVGMVTAPLAMLGGMPQVGLPIAGRAALGQQAVQSSIINPLEQSLTQPTGIGMGAYNAAQEALLKNTMPSAIQSQPVQDAAQKYVVDPIYGNIVNPLTDFITGNTPPAPVAAPPAKKDYEW